MVDTIATGTSTSPVQEDTVAFVTQEEAHEYARKMREDYALSVYGPHWQGTYWIVVVRWKITKEV